jgi:ketosteroid isomerase-like protein
VFDDAPVVVALDRLADALSCEDRLAWVAEYTADAVFDGGGAAAVRGREELLAMAAAMQPLTDVSIRPLRVEGSGNLAVVWFEGSWGHAEPTPDDDRVEVRGILALRREGDGVWRVVLEHLA